MTRAADEPHPDVQRFLEQLAATEMPELHEFEPDDARAAMRQLLPAEPSIELERIEDRTIPGPGGELPIRIYDPATREQAPVVAYFHGGGWVVGDLETHDAGCRKLAAETGAIVVSVDYRLAPEHPFPAALEDCYAAVDWLAANGESVGGDSDRLVVAGDSAGGNLAAATTLLARERNGPEIAYQLLVYPVTGDPTTTPSYEANAEGYLLTTRDMEWFADQYVAREVDRYNILVSPRFAADLSVLPPATVVTAGFDPLRDDGAAYADRLQEAGVAVNYRNYPEMIHGFAGMLDEPIALDRAHELYADLANDLAAAVD